MDGGALLGGSTYSSHTSTSSSISTLHWAAFIPSEGNTNLATSTWDTGEGSAYDNLKLEIIISFTQ